MIEIVTVMHQVATWANTIILLAVLFVSIILLQKARVFLKDLFMDAIQIYAGFQQAKLDAKRNQARLELYQNEARLLMRDQRRQILADLEGGSL